MSKETNYFFASCPKHSEQSLFEEIQRIINVDKIRISRGGVVFSSNYESAIEVCLSSRISSRLFVEIDRFFITTQDDIHEKVKSINWASHFSGHESLKITTLFDQHAKKQFRNSIYISQVIKDGIVDHFHDRSKKRPSVDLKDPINSFTARIEKTKKNDFSVTISLDLSGQALSNRGYRLKGHKAPLRENVAAQIIENLNIAESHEFMWDPMCGTGTLGLEFFLKKYKISPSYFKIKNNTSNPFAFLKHKFFRNNKELKDYYQERKNEILKSIETIKADEDFKIILSDIDEKQINKLKRFLINEKIIQFFDLQVLNATSISSIEKPGIFLTNPPYGERLSEKELVKKILFNFTEKLKKDFKGSDLYLLLPDQELRKSISLKTSKRIEIFNGNIECRLLKYNFY